MTSRTEGADFLALRHGIDIDTRIQFREKDHVYAWKTVDGEWVNMPRSVSGILSDIFPPFNAKKVISNCFDAWNRTGRYKDVMARYNTHELSRSEAESEIEREWERGRDKGTQLHAILELHINTRGLKSHVDPCDEFESELGQFVEWASTQPFTPFRTELSVAWTEQDMPVCGGQIDFLGRFEDGTYVMIDWKRVNKPLGPDERMFGTALAPHQHIPNSSYHKYSLQQSFYAEMMMHTHGYDVGDNMFLLRLHPDCKHAEFVRCINYRATARKLLQEYSIRDDAESHVVKDALCSQKQAVSKRLCNGPKQVS